MILGWATDMANPYEHIAQLEIFGRGLANLLTGLQKEKLQQCSFQRRGGSCHAIIGQT